MGRVNRGGAWGGMGGHAGGGGLAVGGAGGCGVAAGGVGGHKVVVYGRGGVGCGPGGSSGYARCYKWWRPKKWDFNGPCGPIQMLIKKFVLQAQILFY